VALILDVPALLIQIAQTENRYNPTPLQQANAR
jgi:two-component system chemotaxis sensor kinase CheA